MVESCLCWWYFVGPVKTIEQEKMTIEGLSEAPVQHTFRDKTNAVNKLSKRSINPWTYKEEGLLAKKNSACRL